MKSMDLPKMSTSKPTYRYQKPTYDEPVIFHSDQGSQYTSQAVRQALDKHRLVPSFSKKAYPWDNAVNEAFSNT